MTAARRSPSGDGITAPSCTGRSGVRRGEDSGVAAVAAALLVALGCLGIRVDLDLLGFHVGGAVLALQGRGHVARVGRADGVGDGRGVGLVRSGGGVVRPGEVGRRGPRVLDRDRKSTRLNSSHVSISYAVFCLKKKKRS